MLNFGLSAHSSVSDLAHIRQTHRNLLKCQILFLLVSSSLVMYLPSCSLSVMFACTLLLPGAGHTMDQLRCSIASVQIGTLTTGFPMDKPQYVEGSVEVVCSSAGSHPQTLEFGLMDVSDGVSSTHAGAHRSSPPSNMAVELFADSDGLVALPLNAAALSHYPTRQLIPAAGTAQLSIPFFARVAAKGIPAAGQYQFSRSIGLMYRTTAVR
ncbi:MAG: hypothetical protein U1E02_42125 [Hydrogenophaga sp.]|nr:hypothetical protein [Hydrogenophaga sp.]